MHFVEPERIAQRLQLAHEPIDREECGVGDMIGATGAELVVAIDRTFPAQGRPGLETERSRARPAMNHDQRSPWPVAHAIVKDPAALDGDEALFGTDVGGAG